MFILENCKDSFLTGLSEILKDLKLPRLILESNFGIRMVGKRNYRFLAEPLAISVLNWNHMKGPFFMRVEDASPFSLKENVA